MASKISINLDTGKENYIVSKCKQNDDLVLEALIYENGLALDLTNKTITVQALKADGTYIIQSTGITKTNNKIIANLVRDFSRVPGTTKIEIVLVESSKQNTTFSFYLEVVGSVIKGAVQSGDTVTILEALENKIVEAGTVKQETEQLITSGNAATKGDVAQINASLEEIKNKIPSYREIYNNGSSEVNMRLYNYLCKFEVFSDNTVISKVVIDVISQRSKSMIEIAIYDKNFNKLISSDKQEILENGLNQFAFPYRKLEVGSYYIGFATNTSTDNNLFLRGDNKSGYIINAAYPLADSIIKVYEYGTSPYFELYSYSLKEPTGFVFQNRTQYRVFAKSQLTGKVYGWNTSTGKICVSSNKGETFVDLMKIKEAVWTMQIDDVNNRIYYSNSSGKVYESTGLTENDTFNEITPPLKNPISVILPSGFLIWNGYLWYGEYSQASTGELANVINLHKYNLSSKKWSISKIFNDARHIHSFTSQGSIALYVTLGDAGWGQNVGIHRLTSINGDLEDTWTKWTDINGDNTDHYPVDNLLTYIDSVPVLLGAGDRPKIHLTTIKLGNTRAGSVNINARCFGFEDSDSGETVRNVILDDELNCYYVTAETSKPRICVSPYPYIENYILQELKDYSVLTTPITKSGEWIMFHTFRFHTVSFGINKSITYNKRNYLYNNGEIVTFNSGTSGNQTSFYNKNSKSLLIESKCNADLTSQKTGYFTTSTIDITKYKSVFVEGEFLQCTGNNSLRIKVDTSANIDGNVKEIIITNNDLYVNQLFSYKLDISTINGEHYIHVQSVATGLNSKGTIKINKIWLSEI